MTPMREKLLFRALAFGIAASFCSCGSKSVSIPLGNWEEEAALVASSTMTPEHSLPKTEYPFDAQGNYIASWAVLGERRFGKGTPTFASSSEGDSLATTAAKVEAKDEPLLSHGH